MSHPEPPNGWERSAARARALDRLSGPDGIVVGAAIDHRDSMRVALQKRGLPVPDVAALTRLKVRVCRALAPGATVILLDPEQSAAQAIAHGALPRSTALVTPLEAQGYEDVGGVAVTPFLPDWSAAAARRLGADGAKLLLPYRVDDAERAAAQDEVVRQAVSACRAAGLALILEPIVYARHGESTAGGPNFAELVVDGAARLARLGPDILKLQYPGDGGACAALDAACTPAIPWVLLGGGADPAILSEQIEIAARAGASGFIVGRTLFDAALVADEAESDARLADTCRPLLDRLAAVARAHARPWRERVGEIPEPAPGWYAEAAPA